MSIKPIRNERDYDAALVAIHRLMGAGADTPEGEDLEILVTLVETYEAARWPAEAPDPVSVIKHVMEARGLRQKDAAVVAPGRRRPGQEGKARTATPRRARVVPPHVGDP